jgi:hypothetical protein
MSDHHSHIVNGEFQSDKYPTCPPGKVPLSTKDTTAQDLLWIYAQRRRAVDADFANDLERALSLKGFDPHAMPLNEAIREHAQTCIGKLKSGLQGSALILDYLDGSEVLNVLIALIHECIGLTIARDALTADLQDAKKVMAAAKRMIEGKYLPWSNAGGVNECPHHRGEDVPCPECDKATVTTALDRYDL